MFNKKLTKNNVSAVNNQSPSVNIISEGTKLKGNINSSSDIRISGTVDGEAISKGKIIVTENGSVLGNISFVDADVAGKIEGDVRVSNKLVLRQTAVIDGNIYTKTIIVEEGAQINGAVKMGADIKSISQNSDVDYANETKLKESK